MNSKSYHWLNFILCHYNIKSRYELYKLGNLSQSTSSDIINNNTSFGKISVDTLHKIILAITNSNINYDYNDILINIWSNYIK